MQVSHLEGSEHMELTWFHNLQRTERSVFWAVRATWAWMYSFITKDLLFFSCCYGVQIEEDRHHG